MAEIETRTRAMETRLGQAHKEAQRIREEWLKNGEEVRARAVAEAREQAARIMERK